MYLESINETRSSHTLKDNKNNIDQRQRSMKVAAQQEDLELLAKTLQEHLRTQVASGELFQVKCAVKNDQLMILTQHPVNVTADTQKIFAVLEEALQPLPAYWEQRVQFFLRFAGEKLPYAKHYLSLAPQPEEPREKWETLQSSNQDLESDEEIETGGEISHSPLSTFANETQADAPKLSKPSQPLPAHRVKLILLGVGLPLIAAFGAGAYVATRPCVMFQCLEMRTSQELQRKSSQQLRSAKSEQQLLSIQQQLETASASLKTIPSWSPRSPEKNQILADLSSQSGKINLVVKALQAASIAESKTEKSANSLEELQARQQQWRQAIAPLETLNPKSELYQLAQQKLPLYRRKLQAVNQQLVSQEKWLQKITAAKAVANAAQKNEATVYSLQELQKVHSTWLVAVNALNSIPQNSPGYPEAQKLLQEYKPKLSLAGDRATKEQLAAKAYQQAVSAANQAKSYQQQNQWQGAVTYWDQALNAAKQIPSQSLYYTQAQNLIQPYSTALKQAEEKLQISNIFQQARTDLQKTCSAAVRICNFTVDNQGITVRITPEYEQVLQSSLINANPQDPNSYADVTNHLQILQQALSVISENSNLPLVVYDAQGKQIQTRTTGG